MHYLHKITDEFEDLKLRLQSKSRLGHQASRNEGRSCIRTTLLDADKQLGGWSQSLDILNQDLKDFVDNRHRIENTSQSQICAMKLWNMKLIPHKSKPIVLISMSIVYLGYAFVDQSAVPFWCFFRFDDQAVKQVPLVFESDFFLIFVWLCVPPGCLSANSHAFWSEGRNV